MKSQSKSTSTKALSPLKTVQNVLTVAFFTLASRLGGFIRDALILAFIGVGPVFDAFIVAFKLPNFFRRLSAEGAFSSAFVPMFSGVLASEGKKEAIVFANQALMIMICALLFLVVGVLVFTPSIMWIVAPGLDPERLAMAIDFTRITFPYILFISVAALMSGVLNSLGRFALASAAPILMNVVMVVALLGLSPFLKTSGHALAWGVFFSGFIQLCFVWWGVSRLHIRFQWQRPQLSSQMRLLFRKMAPGLLGASVFQINVFLDLLIASFLPVGSLTYLYAADRLNQLPLSVIGVAVSTAFLPTLSRHIELGQVDAARKGLLNATILALSITLPAALSLFVLAHPIISVLFLRGAFLPQDAYATALTLQAFVVGLPAYVLMKVLTTGFFAKRDTLTPVVVAIGGVGLNLLLNLVFIRFFSYVGIALATSISAWVSCCALFIILRRSNLLLIQAGGLVLLGKMMLCCLILCGCLWEMKKYFSPWLFSPHWIKSAGALGCVVVVGVGVYLISALYLKLVSIDELKKLMRRSSSSTKKTA